MSKLEQLIRDLCPNGVEFVPIGSVVNYEQPTKYIVSSTSYSDKFSIPVLTAGQTFILGYTDEEQGIYESSKKNPVIIFDDFTGAIQWVDFPFKVKSSAMKILTANEKLASIRYIYHVMANMGFSSSAHKRLWIGTYSAFKIPMPPLEVQREIVRILDNFTELTAELSAKLADELTARKKQYEFYRDCLLNLDPSSPNRPQGECSQLLQHCQKDSDVVFVTLPEISENCDSQRQPITSNKRVAGAYPYYGASGIVDYVNDYIFDGDFLLVSEDGANLLARSTPIAFSIEGKNWVNNHAHVLKFDTYATRRYVEFYLNSINLSQYITGGAQPKLNKQNLNKIRIPLPPLKRQEQIVSILDRFNALCNDLTAGLPAEIEARRKQYEYYRDKLLTFAAVS